LVLVLTLGLVVILTFEAARPERWFWMWGGRPPAERAMVPPKPIDNSVTEPPAADHRRLEATAAAPAEKAAGGRYFPGVQPELLKTIRDDTILRRTETDAFYHLLQLLADSSEQELTAASAGHVTFAQLFQQSNEYRGELVTVRGTVRRAVEKTAPPNDYGLGQYYEVWIVPHDQRDSPLVVNCLELPAAFPQSDSLAEDASITGFYFKRFAYQAGDGRLHTTPLLLAKTVAWSPAAPVAKKPANLAAFLWCTAIAAVLASIAVMYIRRRSARPRPTDLPDRVEWDGAV
jgi:hypothetical protein